LLPARETSAKAKKQANNEFPQNSRKTPPPRSIPGFRELRRGPTGDMDRKKEARASRTTADPAVRFNPP